MAKSIEIDRKKRLRNEPHKGHNRWHPDIAPVIEAEPGEEVTLETRDANDLQIHAGTTAKDLEKLERTVAHPLTGAVPAEGKVAAEGLRTIPPRENCGNADVKQLTKGSKLFVPVAVDGALYSVGDGHYAQGDSECCGTAIEMGATAVVRFRIYRGEATAKKIVWPRFSHPGFFAKPEHGMPRNFIATMGMPITAEGRNENCDITLAARNAVIEMIQLLQERGWTREQAYVLCSVAVDLRVSNVVDVPNVTVSALLPEDIFNSG